MPKLQNNTELYQYLLALADRLEGTSAAPLATHLQFAAGQATGLSTEFLGESLIALKKVLDGENGVLKNSDREELRSLISQIESVVRR
jgi:hypothetical protein